MSYLAFDFETSYAFNMGYDDRAYPVLLCVITDKGDKYEWVLNHNTLTYPFSKKDLDKIQTIFNSVATIIAHNAKFDLHWLRRIGIDYSKNKIYCTQVAEYIINGENNRVLYSLAATSKRYGIHDKHDTVKDWWDAGYETADIPLKILIPYCYQDTANTLAIYQKQQPIIERNRQQRLIAMQCELVRILEDIEWNGMLIDVEKCKQYSISYGERIDQINIDLNSFVRSTILEFSSLPDYDSQGKSLPNFGSGEQLSCILFGGTFKYKGRIAGAREGTFKNGTVELQIEGLKLVPKKGTETANGYYQTDKAQFKDLKLNNKKQKEFIQLLEELSKLEKMKGTYFDNMLKHEINGIVHCNIHQTRTVTGRLSETDPALQTIPRGSTSPVKDVFITRYGYE